MNERDLAALAEKCGAEVGRYEGEVVWIKFHKPSIAPFAAALSQPHASAQEAAHWKHAANEWADMATNAVQHIRNIKDGITTPHDALVNLLECLVHCQEVQAAPHAPTEPAGWRDDYHVSRALGDVVEFLYHAKAAPQYAFAVNEAAKRLATPAPVAADTLTDEPFTEAMKEAGHVVVGTYGYRNGILERMYRAMRAASPARAIPAQGAAPVPAEPREPMSEDSHAASKLDRNFEQFGYYRQPGE